MSESFTNTNLAAKNYIAAAKNFQPFRNFLQITNSYYNLAKPGIIYGNLLTAIGGFLLACHGHIYGWLLLQTMVGLALIIGSACVVNNYIDRGLDQKMDRTKSRALVRGTVRPNQALIYAAILGLSGSALLAFYTNPLTLALGLAGVLIYIVFYGLGKRYTVHGTIIGSFAGAVPIAVGYTARSGHFDILALLLFLIMVLWQMPHFYAIAIYRAKDYSAAGLPVLPVKKGFRNAQWQIMVYIIAFLCATLSLSILGYTGYSYAVVMGLLGLTWLVKGFGGFKTADQVKWAHKMFGFSLLVIMLFSLMLPLGSWLP